MAITLKQRYQKEFNPKSGVFGTQFTKNTYSKDISGGGFSGQPFIKRPIPSLDDEPIGQYYSLATQALSLDFPVRGGSYEEIASREDFARIDRFFLYYPQGKAFTDKYRSLLRSNPKIESGREAGDSNTRIFPIGNSGLGSRNMIEQIASVGVGFHLPNAGSDIFSLTEQEDLYGRIVAKKPTNENRLVSLYNLKILPEPNPDFNRNNATRINTGMSAIRDSVELFNYDGGPNSLYGQTSTLIRRATDNLGAIMDTNNAPNFLGSSTLNFKGDEIQGTPFSSGSLNMQKFLGASAFAESINLPLSLPKDVGLTVQDENNSRLGNLANQQTTGSIRTIVSTDANFKFNSVSRYDQLMKMGDRNPSTITINDFRKDVNDPTTVSKKDYTSTDINKATRVGIGNPGARRIENTTDINDTNGNIGQDKVNITEIEDGPALFTDEKRDLIKFGFDVLGNDSGNPFKSVHFRAFLTGYSDSHSADWQSKRYAGRGDSFYTYQGFDRTVSFNFKVAAQSKQEMRPLYEKLNFLLSTLYPDYAPDTGFMRGNIVRLTIGDLFVRTPGILESLNLTVDDNYPWEIAFDEPEGGSSADMKETPQILDVAASFKPILNQLPRLDQRILSTYTSTLP